MIGSKLALALAGNLYCFLSTLLKNCESKRLRIVERYSETEDVIPGRVGNFLEGMGAMAGGSGRSGERLCFVTEEGAL